MRSRELARDGGARSLPRQDRPAAGHLFQRLKIRWILDNVPGARARAEAGELLFGNIDTFLLWNLTGGLHVTDCTNASRTQLMNLETLDWDADLLDAFRIPRAMLPRICSSSEVYGECHARCASTACPSPASWAISRRRSSARPASTPGEAKNTYGTGCFLLMNTGTKRPFAARHADHGGVQARRRSRRVTRWKAASRSPARWCSGSATTSA